MAEQNSGDSAFAFLLGGVVGAGIALLLAPTTGEETRKRVGQWLKETEKKGEKFLKEQRELLAKKGAEAAEVLEDRKGRLDAALKAGKKAYKDAS